PGEVGNLEHDVRLAVVAHHKHDVRFRFGCPPRTELAQIHAAHPVLRNLEADRLFPLTLDDVVLTVGGCRLGFTRRETHHRAERLHQPTALPAVIAHPVDVELII